MFSFAFAQPLEDQSRDLLNTTNTESNQLPYDLEGNWTAEWHSDSAILKDEVIVRQANDEIITEYAKSPVYPDCEGNKILPGDLYFEGVLVSESKIEGSSWACQSGVKTSIPLTLEIQDEGNRMEGTWTDNQDRENKFVFIKDIENLT